VAKRSQRKEGYSGGNPSNSYDGLQSKKKKEKLGAQIRNEGKGVSEPRAGANDLHEEDEKGRKPRRTHLRKLGERGNTIKDVKEKEAEKGVDR